jgi:hypothetical protein
MYTSLCMASAWMDSSRQHFKGSTESVWAIIERAGGRDVPEQELRFLFRDSKMNAVDKEKRKSVELRRLTRSLPKVNLGPAFWPPNRCCRSRIMVGGKGTRARRVASTSTYLR